MIEIDKFKVTDNFVFGFIKNGNENYDGSYFIYNLKNNSIKTFGEESDYINFLRNEKLEEKPEYNDFSYYYAEYWNGWRFWLLP